MNKYIFLYREKNSYDRDCCAYIENIPIRFECDHYFGSIILHGACYCNRDFADYDDIETALTREEYEALRTYNDKINELGYGIKKGDVRYNRGLELGKNIEYVYDKLNSAKAKAFQQQIIDDEVKYLKDEYNLDDKDIEKIFNEYHLDYRDRAIVGYIFKDTEDLGYEEAWSFGYINPKDPISSKYFDYEKFGEDLIKDENYLELDDGRVVSLMY